VAARWHHHLRYPSHRFRTPEGPTQLTRSDVSEVPAETPDGRHSLRLVKLRLALTLVAVALVPLAALAPIIRTIVDDPRIAQHERLAAQSEHAAAEIQREMAGIRLALQGIAANEAIPIALGAAPASAKTAAAAVQLATAVARSSGVVVAAAVVDATGVAHAVAGITTTPLSPDPLPGTDQPQYRIVDGIGGGAASVEIFVDVPGAAGAQPAGAVVASVPLDALLRWANVDPTSAAQRLAIVDPNNEPLAVISTQASSSSDASPAIDVTGDTSSLATSGTLVTLSGVPAWQVVATAPLAIAALPLPALLTLGALLLLLVGATVWMGRKILEPAAELDSQRTHFQSLYQTAREAALLDNLTGLGNHRAFQEAVGRTVEQVRRYGTRFALVLLDIDEFKQVNDTKGHATGDELLAEVGELIRATIRASDSGFRIGGDEFAVLLAETDAAGAAVTARRILSRGLEGRGTGRYRGAISFSAGVTACPEFGTTRLELTAQADAAMYRGKRGGRTIVTVFDPAADRGHVDDGMRAELSTSVSAVIEAGALTAVYQPIVHLPTGRILGYEGLVRVDPSYGFPHTGALFDAAEIAGRVLDLDRATLDVVLRGSHAIPEQTLISLNVSPRSFEAPEFNATVFLAILRRHGVDPGRVLLELTERDAIIEPARLREAVRALQEAGVRVAADDVGAGNAGLRLLSQIRFDVVKIDLSFVQGGAGKDQTLSVLTSLVDLARRWGALTIAEGVETAEQLRMIRQLEVDAGQGYLLGRPGAAMGPLTIDLDELAGEPTIGRPGAAEPAAPRIPGSFSFPTPAAVPVPVPVAVPTAASVLAGSRPSVFISH
jgi:diguanylate cyclase (GGDEF)-like protein